MTALSLAAIVERVLARARAAAPLASTVALVGSRRTPPAVCRAMERAAADLARAGIRGRSGNSPGADRAWARGVNAVDPAALALFLPWSGFGATAVDRANAVTVVDRTVHAWAFERARAAAPGWPRLAAARRWAALRLLARNALILLGRDGRAPVQCVIGYIHPEKEQTGGGTGHTFRIAHATGIPVYRIAPGPA